MGARCAGTFGSCEWPKVRRQMASDEFLVCSTRQGWVPRYSSRVNHIELWLSRFASWLVQFDDLGTQVETEYDGGIWMAVPAL